MKCSSVVFWLGVFCAALAVIPLHAAEMVLLLHNRQVLPAGVSNPEYVVPAEAVSSKHRQIIQAANGRTVFERLQRYVVVSVSDSAVHTVYRSPAVEQAWMLRPIPLHNEPYSQDSLSADQYALGILKAVKCWELATGKGVRVAVVDTGIDWDHPDLKNRLAVNPAEDINKNGKFEPWPSTMEINGITGDLDGADNDGNGYTDDVIGYDFVHQRVANIGDARDRDPIPADEQGHGTSVAGVIAAQANNEIGIAGLAHGARIVTLRAFDATGNADEGNIAAAIVYAALNQIPVVNMSFGDGVDSPVLRDAVQFAAAMGCFLVASAGNTGTVSRQFPSGYNNVLAVGATNARDVRAVFSSTGSLVNMVAPGEAIVTTAVGSRYRTVNGTSFSAPYVAATAALMLELHPELTAQEIRGVLLETCKDLGASGWDREYGTGRLDSYAALTHVGTSAVDITYPENETQITIANTPISVTGSAYATLFSSYRVDVGEGVEPDEWVTVAQADHAIAFGELASIPASLFTGTEYVIRLVVRLKTGAVIESRRRIYAVKPADTLRIIHADVVQAWKDDKRVGILTVQTSRPVQVALAGSPANPDDREVFDARASTMLSFEINSERWGNNGPIRVQCVAQNGDTADITIPYSVNPESAPVLGWQQKSSGNFTGYVLNTVQDITGSGNEEFLMSDLQTGVFGPIVLMQRVGVDFVAGDKTDQIWIPRGICDANGNGITEVLAGISGKTVLFERSTSDNNPFGHIIYADTVTGNTPAGVADIDGDGLDDLVLLSNSACVVVGWRNNAWTEIGRIENPTPPAAGNADNRIDEVSVGIGDFDGDGAMEIAFSDTDGDLVIAEYKNNEFKIVYTLEGSGVGGSGYVAAGDVTGDGKPDVLVGVPDDPYINSNREYGRQTWTYRLITSDAPNSYLVTWEDRVSGVRYGYGYRNGVEIANVDGRPGDEMIICAFPRMYIFTTSDTGTIVPIWFRSGVVTPRFLTHDFDRNGIAELGYGVSSQGVGLMDNFDFAEYVGFASRLEPPSGVRAVSLDSVKARITWSSVPNAVRYRVYWNSDGSGLFRISDSTESTSFEVDTLTANRMYRFTVVAIAADPGQNSQRSAIVPVYTGDRLNVVRLSPAVTTTTRAASDLQLIIQFSGPLSDSGLDAGKIMLTNSQGAAIAAARSISLGGDSTVIVSFGSIEIPAGAYRVVVEPVSDVHLIPTNPSAHELVVIADTTHPELRLERLDVVQPTELMLWYSMPVTESALAPEAYTIRPYGVVETVERIADNQVRLNLATDPPLSALGVTYSLTVRDVASESGIPITRGLGNTLSFVLTMPNAGSVFVYPHPVRLNASTEITFANLPAKADIEILDQRLSVIQTLSEFSGTGGLTWDLRDHNGVRLSPGIYYYRVSGINTHGEASQSPLLKLLIMR